MSKLEWNRPQDQTFETGVDRGVIYVEGGSAVAWSGLSSVQDGGESTLKEFYIDGIKYLAVISPRDWKGSLVAYTYPEAFGAMLGIEELADGLYADSQAPGRFGLSYRTMVTAPAVDKKQHYKIHLIYKVMASLGPTDYTTLSAAAADPSSFEFELAAVPIKIPGFRPTAHIILDTRKMDAPTLSTLEAMLYGDANRSPTMPTIDELIDLLKFGDDVTVVDNGDGTWTASGSNKNVYMTDATHFGIDNVAAVYESDSVYRFLEAVGASSFSALVDDDGGLYFAGDVGPSNIGLDTDIVPYFLLGEDDAQIHEDTDGVPYFEI